MNTLTVSLLTNQPQPLFSSHDRLIWVWGEVLGIIAFIKRASGEKKLNDSAFYCHQLCVQRACLVAERTFAQIHIQHLPSLCVSSILTWASLMRHILFTPQTDRFPPRPQVVKLTSSWLNLWPFKHDKEAVEVVITIIHHVRQWWHPALR